MKKEVERLEQEMKKMEKVMKENDKEEMKKKL